MLPWTVLCLWVSAGALGPCGEVIEICTAGILLLGRRGWAKLPGLAAPQLSSRGSCCNELPRVLACVGELAKGSMVVRELVINDSDPEWGVL